MVKVKICGITNPVDANDAVQAGADALGFVFYGPSPRCIDIDSAAAIIASLPPFVMSVGLFVNPLAHDVEAAIDRCKLDLLQFHGDERAPFCRSFSRPYIKAIRMRPGLELAKEIEEYPCARGILLDSYDPSRYGGTGLAFDWNQVGQNLGKPLILAGGLTPDNVADGIRRVSPWAVDVSGGVESSKGKKDSLRMQAFLRGAKGG